MESQQIMLLFWDCVREQINLLYKPWLTLIDIVDIGLEITPFIPLISALIDLLTTNIHYLSTGTINHGQTLSYLTHVSLTHLWLKQSPPWDQQCLSHKLRLAETLEIFPPFLRADGPVYFPKITWVFSLPNSHSSRDSGSWQCLTSHLMVPCSTGEFFKQCARELNFITGIWELLKKLGTWKFRFFFFPAINPDFSVMVTCNYSNSTQWSAQSHPILYCCPLIFGFTCLMFFPLCFQKLQKSFFWQAHKLPPSHRQKSIFLYISQRCDWFPPMFSLPLKFCISDATLI